ncbi:MAG: hypothetical protein NWF06_00035 [Candidatus Bathyarchaeota archaeon]|nr:hypothetical protein [Candidatus Bathyarchaeum sp.]
MKRASLLTTLFLGLFFSVVAGTQFINVGTAETDDNHLPISVSIPEGRAYTVINYNVYSTNDVTLYFLVDHDYVYANQLQNDLVTVDLYQYNLDGRGNLTFNPVSQYTEYHYYPNGGKSVTEINGLRLTNLSEGEHSIVVYAKMRKIIARYSSTFGELVDIGSTIAISNTKLFTVDTNSPIISILVPKNNEYYTSGVPLDFTINDTTSKITYCLDTQEKKVITGNITLTNLLSGEHSLTVYAIDDAGNIGASETVTFTIVVRPNSECFPITSVVAISVPVAIVSVGFIFYIMKRKH